MDTNPTPERPTAHALQQLKRGQPPHHVAEFVASEQAFLSQTNQAKHKESANAAYARMLKVT